MFLCYNLAGLRGVEVREVPSEGQHIPVERMARAMDGRTRVVTASHVTFAPVFTARYGVELGEGAHGTAVGDASFAFKAGALRFELSNYNYLGLATVLPSVGESRGGRVGEAEDPAMNELHDYLINNGVGLSIRRGTLRMALGIYNNGEDVDRVVNLCRAWGGDRGKT